MQVGQIGEGASTPQRHRSQNANDSNHRRALFHSLLVHLNMTSAGNFAWVTLDYARSMDLVRSEITTARVHTLGDARRCDGDRASPQRGGRRSTRQ